MADYDNGVYSTDTYGGAMRAAKYAEAVMGDLTPLTDLQDLFPDDTSIGLDTSYGTGFILYYPQKSGATDTVSFPSQWLPRESTAERNQTILESGGGNLSVYDSGYAKKLITLHIDQASELKRKRLYIFLVNIVKNALKTFQLEDESGTLYTVRCVDGIFAMPMYAWLLHSKTLLLRKE
jgi:hypothetical protein